ncbi:MAG TPA: ABC transporter permease [bacterium]|nr:ABC transporter permease [bacterium]
MHGLLIQTLNGVTFAGLLFLLASGFTLVFGLMRIVNMAHGSTYLAGGYVGYSVLAVTHSFVAALVVGSLAMAMFGVVLERGLLIRIRGLVMSELLLTMGVAFIVGDLSLAVWGGNPLVIHLPAAFRNPVHVATLTYPANRLLLLGVAIVVAALLYYLLNRTRVGAMIRAGVDNREMTAALGININAVFTLVFTLGALLAGLAGVLGGNLLTLYPGGDSDILTLAVVVIIVGGIGTFWGAAAGSLIVGLLTTYGNAYFPEMAYFSLFLPMIVVLLWRPQGLFGLAMAGGGTARAGAGGDGVARKRAAHAVPRRRRAPRRIPPPGPVWQIALAGACVGAALLIPHAGSTFYISIVLSILIFGLLAMSLDLLAGYTGLVSLGHASFLGIAAYSIAYGTGHGMAAAPAIPFALGITLAVAAVFGFLVVRVRQLTFVMLTLALGQVVWGLAYRWTSVLGGDNGLPVAGRPAIGPLNLTDAGSYYYFAVAAFIVCAVLLWLIVNSPFGLVLKGIRENEERMSALGFAVGLHKYLAFLIASLFAGVAGVLFAFFNLYVSPTTIDFQHNGIAVLMSVVGGLGTLWGPLIGAVIVVLTQQYVSIFITRWVTLLGIIFVLTVLFARRGVYDAVRLLLSRFVGAPPQPAEPGGLVASPAGRPWTGNG